MGLIAENCYINGCKVEANSLFLTRQNQVGKLMDYWWFRNRNVMDMELTVWRMWNVACVFMRIRRMMIFSIKTDISGSYEQEIGGGGIVLYDDKGVKIIERVL